MINVIKKFFALPHLTAKLNLDDTKTSLLHREIILSKPVLKKIYTNWYADIMSQIDNNGKILELGSGGGFLKDLYPQVITSDIMTLSCCDMVVDALNLPFENESLDAIVMINVFHHIQDAAIFLNEVNRTLKPNGKLIMIEPSCNNIWSSFIYKYIHHEPLDKHADWKFESTGPLSDANIALPYIVFERDIALCNQLFPSLNIKINKYYAPFTYLLSGGVSMKSLMPNWSFNMINAVEKLITHKYLNMFYMINVQKN